MRDGPHDINGSGSAEERQEPAQLGEVEPSGNGPSTMDRVVNALRDGLPSGMHLGKPMIVVDDVYGHRETQVGG